MPFVAVAEGSPDSASVAGGDENSMGKARNSLDPTKPQFSQVELCEVAEIRMATAELDFDRSSSAGGCGEAAELASRDCFRSSPFLSSFIRPSEQISRGTVTGRRNSRTRLRGFLPSEPNIRTLKRGGGEK